ncbi:tubulin-folding cofactor C [Dendrobium catenatum]|uniref:Tubulin-folding cofactor C n=1 Tax=Dendrobium catenatum TaxID=906689 RepID=A0A2I0VTI8_9ASPA|nr:tubulin-folding cofactor C [Dendrobium catenatum]XP_020682582.1 tubulin-folding cofactor C [Dendrobium catenatum]PKU66737.1 Tubulin-folding cofactor C [Dendrobium catenatum]
MEGDELQKPNGLPVETLDMIAQKKHAAMLERLSNNHQSRLQQSAARRTAADFSSPSFESVQSFLSLFSDAKRSVEADLHRCRAIAAADPKAKSQIKLELDKVSESISDLEKIVSEHSYFLPPYEVRSSLKTIEELKEMVESANAEIAPRKKFTFKSKASSKKEPAALAKESEQFITVSNAASQNISLSDSPGFRNKQGEILIKRFRVSESEGDFSIVDLDSCDVYLKGRFRALFIHRLRNCRIFTGPVLGSILIEDVNNCLFMLASHQIRIHQARECDFYLRVRSRPIIEDCSGLRFAPYRLLYEGIDKDLSDSGLEEETRNWANVDDFRWLRAVQSPNWCLIPEEEFVAVRNISELEEKSGDT